MTRKVNRPTGAGGAKTQEGKIEAEPAGRHQALINSTKNALIKPACSLLIFFYFFLQANEIQRLDDILLLNIEYGTFGLNQ